jgi:Mg-chelatase subunit ChlD
MDTLPLSYLISHPTAVRIGCTHPLFLLLAAGALVFLLRHRRAGRGARLARTAAVLSIVLALAGVHLTAPLPDQRLSVVVAVDVSGSIDATGREWTQRYVSELTRALAPEDEVAVLTFAKDVRVVQAPGAPASSVPDLALPAAAGATDIARALDTAMALFTPERQARLLLLSDGHETRGDARARLPHLRAATVRVDAAVPPHVPMPDVAVDKLVVAPAVVDGRTFPMRIVAHNTGKPQPAVFSLFLDDTLVESAALEVASGASSFELPYSISGHGGHRVRAELQVANDPFAANNAREMPVMVSGQPRLLLASTRHGSPLARVLQRKQMTVDVRPPAEIPESPAELLRYQGVVLEDLTAGDVRPAALTALHDYVHDFGGGLVVTGGGSTFGDERFKSTALRQLLPVTLEPRRPRRTQREPLALFLVIDRSNSMGYNSRIGTLRDGEKLRYAKEAALAVIRQLKDHDLVGLIAFDSQPWEIAPLRPLREHRAQLEDDIPRLIENGGTDFYDALMSARRQLGESRVNRRHIMLLTDGDTNRADMDDYTRLLDEMVASQISITTVRIGDDTVNLKLLRTISDRTGGEFHHVENAETLPDLMLRDTTRALEPTQPDQEQYFPHVGVRSQLLRGVPAKSIPPLAGYAYARLKPGAELLLHIPRPERRDPILSVWQYGLGRVAAFTASPVDDAEAWAGWDAFGKLWSQLAQWTIREHGAFDYAIDAQRADGRVALRVRTFDAASSNTVLLARIDTGDGVRREVSLMPQRPREFTATLPALPGGRYPLTLIRRDGRQDVVQQTAVITVPAADDAPREEEWPRGANLPLLRQLTDATGGTLNPGVRELVKREPGTRRLAYPLEHLLIPLAMLLFLGDVALRKLAPR